MWHYAERKDSEIMGHTPFGYRIENGKAVIDIAWHLSFFPGLMIFIITFCLIQISDYLQNMANKKDLLKN